MSTNEATVTTNSEPRASVVDAVFDAALAWAEHGLGLAKTALEGSARAMERTARSLDTVRDVLRDKAA
ncbi:MAG TPA: hypothetical protein VIF62_34225 [Labilithrix sp.]